MQWDRWVGRCSHFPCALPPQPVDRTSSAQNAARKGVWAASERKQEYADLCPFAPFPSRGFGAVFWPLSFHMADVPFPKIRPHSYLGLGPLWNARLVDYPTGWPGRRCSLRGPAGPATAGAG